MKTPRRPASIKKWNRRIHIWLGLYMLLFLWVIAVSGLFMNHPGWFNAQPVRTSVEQTVMMPEAVTDLEKATDIMDQLGITGEVLIRGNMPEGKFDFTCVRPNLRQFVSVDLATFNATLQLVDLQLVGTLGDLHTFTGVRGIYREPNSIRDWLPTRIWSFSMDAVAIGVILMVLTSLYMGWQRLKVHPLGSMASFALGIIVTVYFMWGLAWLG